MDVLELKDTTHFLRDFGDIHHAERHALQLAKFMLLYMCRSSKEVPRGLYKGQN